MTAKVTPITIKIILTTRPIPSSPELVVAVVWVGAEFETAENGAEDLVVETEERIDEERLDEPVDVTLAFVPIKSTIPSQSPDRSVVT